MAELADAGAVGINLEDGRPDGTLAPVGLLVDKVAAVTERVPGVLVNARTDAYWLPGSVADPAAEVLRRGLALRDAGAHAFFVPGLPDDLVARVAAEVPLPLNVLHRPGGPSIERLAEAGVARVSTGSGLYRTALHAALAAAVAAAGPRAPSDGPPPPLTYAEVGRLVERLRSG